MNKQSTVRLERFYVYDHATGDFKVERGEKVYIEDIKYFLIKENEGRYVAIEGRSGILLGIGEEDKQKSIERIGEAIAKNKEQIERIIEQIIEINGTSPLYKDV